ncbi:hypothetical protein NQ317_003731 [Molorchus minor]|uniref:Uncharacterized protein n=1 Tax=Molorchus minor TaxID=1323400 RepID=A0ABQ9IPL4_9CUCU|nr:hypothetical protein NQ317_003731 [Molorchus minor]
MSYKGNFRFVAHKIQKTRTTALWNGAIGTMLQASTVKMSILSYFEQNSKNLEVFDALGTFFNDKGYVKCREQSRYNSKEKDIRRQIFEVLKYLFKVVAVMGILGVCRREKLCQISLNKIADLGSTLVVKSLQIARLDFQEPYCYY